MLVGYSLTIISPKQLATYFVNAHYQWIAFGLFFGVLSHLSRAYRWKFLLEPMGYKPRFINNTFAVLVGYFVNLALPRAGEVSRAAVMTNYENIPFEKGFGTIVAERIADMVMMLIIVSITLSMQFDFIFELLSKNFNPLKIGVLFLVGLASLFLLLIFIKKSTSKVAKKINGLFNGLKEGLTSIFRMKHRAAFIFHTVFIWLMYIAMFWATIPAVEGLNISFGGILVGFIAGGFSIAATNGGIGLYPIAVAGALSLFGIDKITGNAFGWIMWTSQTVMIVAFGGLSFLLLPLFNRSK